jgi:hypothetical protein
MSRAKPGKKPRTQDFAARACWMLPRRMGIPSVTARTTGSLFMGARRANGQRLPDLLTVSHDPCAALLKASFKIIQPESKDILLLQASQIIPWRCRENLPSAEQRRTTTPNRRERRRKQRTRSHRIACELAAGAGVHATPRSLFWLCERFCH